MNYSTLDDFFASLHSQTSSDFRVYLTDTSVQPQSYPYPTWVTVTHAQNKGYAAAINASLKKAQSHSQFCVVNNDVIVAKDFVAQVRHTLSKNPSSLIGAKIYYAPGYEYHATEKKGNVLWYAGGTIDKAHALTHHRGVDEVDNHQYDTPGLTEFITGCCMCFDNAVIKKIGYMDESYFMYYEDADYCMRAHKHNIPVRYEPRIVLWHKNAQSSGGAGSQLHEHYQRRNRLRFSFRYLPLRTTLHLVKNYVLQK